MPGEPGGRVRWVLGKSPVARRLVNGHPQLCSIAYRRVICNRGLSHSTLGGETMPGKADIITYVILGVFALAIIVFAMMNSGYKGPG